MFPPPPLLRQEQCVDQKEFLVLKHGETKSFPLDEAS
jgi:hypothetical protein